MKVAPEKSYETEVYFNEMLGRWFVKFSSTKYDIQYEFPLSDLVWNSYRPNTMEGGVYQPRPHMSADEEGVLALVFSQMVATVKAAAVRSRFADQVTKTGGATEGALGA